MSSTYLLFKTKKKVCYPWWDSTQCNHRLSKLDPHKECTPCNVQSLLLYGFRRAAAYSLKGIASLQVICKKYQVKIAVSGRNAGNDKKNPTDFGLPMLHAKRPSRLNNMNSQVYIELSRLFHLLPIYSYLIQLLIKCISVNHHFTLLSIQLQMTAF